MFARCLLDRVNGVYSWGLGAARAFWS